MIVVLVNGSFVLSDLSVNSSWNSVLLSSKSRLLQLSVTILKSKSRTSHMGSTESGLFSKIAGMKALLADSACCARERQK